MLHKRICFFFRMSIDIPWFASVQSSKNTFEKSCLICDTLFNVAYFRQLNCETMRVVSLLEHVDTTEVAGKWEIFRLQTCMSDPWLCRKLDPEETYYFLPLLTPGTWNVTSCEHMDRSSYNFFEQTHEGRCVISSRCSMHCQLLCPFELGISPGIGGLDWTRIWWNIGPNLGPVVLN